MIRLPTALVVTIVVTGCAATRSADSPTGGVRFEFQVRGEQSFAVYYRVGDDGTLGFGGGDLAFAREVGWSTPMTGPEIAELTELLETHGWFDHAPADTNEPPDHVSKVWLRSPRGFRRFTVKGMSPNVSPIEEHLAGISRRRLDPFLESLPAGKAFPGDEE